MRFSRVLHAFRTRPWSGLSIIQTRVSHARLARPLYPTDTRSARALGAASLSYRHAFRTRPWSGLSIIQTRVPHAPLERPLYHTDTRFARALGAASLSYRHAFRTRPWSGLSFIQTHTQKRGNSFKNHPIH